MASSMSAMILKRLQNICQLRPRHINIQRNRYDFRNVPPAREIEACEDVFEEMESKGIHMKKQPGAVRKPLTKLPKVLHNAATVLLDKYPVKDLNTHSKRLQTFLKVRKHKVTPEEYEELIAEKIKLIKSKEGITEEETRNPGFEEKLRAKAIKKLRPAYSWSPMNYTGAKVIQYLGARLTGDYSAIVACLNEIYARDPDFSPINVFDFGSGLGTTVWATSSIFKKAKVEDFLCVDHSADMNTVARLLLQDGEEDGIMKLPVHFRTNMPSDKKKKFDLVVCTYTLMELESREEIQKVVESLWNMTENYLVLVEKGGQSGFKLMHEAREHLLKLSKESKEGHIFAPCPHHGACPKLTETNTPCFFEAKYATFENIESKGYEKEWFSYVIFKVGPKTHRSFPRLVNETLKRNGHTHCYLCCSDAKLRHVIFSASQHGKQLFKCTRSAKWGDMLPARVKVVYDEQNSLIKDNNIKSNVNKQFLHGNIDHIDDESVINHQYEELSVHNHPKDKNSFVDNHPDEVLPEHNYPDEESSVDKREESIADDNEELSVNNMEESLADDKKESSVDKQ
ncbi:hypothetical protein LOTGIDRAFT_239481 [Lottia gigantea]|uniref:Methyltransferase domain-containing protein n=1 Tax=Lottia gigantea TaxID=225164 RepID=V3ZTV1_LOTGI|nr:hypothetical protein LOTGIDRAFT_239481 [Lottia gigantea]ESO94873.1 hypothetical protein LOTGIDRAFT_239481 [Lottia gigantea]